MTHDNDLDRAIDATAKEMTSGSPSRGFAGRVQERLEPRDRKRWWWVSIPAAAAALVLWLLPGVSDPPPEHPLVPERHDRVLHGPQPGSRPDRDERPRTSLAAARDRPHQRAERPVPVGQPIPIEFEPGAALPVLPDIPDLGMQEIQVAELTIAPLEPDKEPR